MLYAGVKYHWKVEHLKGVTAYIYSLEAQETRYHLPDTVQSLRLLCHTHIYMCMYKHLDIQLQDLLGQKQCYLQEVELSTRQLQKVVLDWFILHSAVKV